MNTQNLKELARRATGGIWKAFINEKTNTFAIHTPDDARCGNIVDWMGFDGVDCSKKQKAHNARFIAASNPAAVIELIERLESAERERDELRERLSLVREQRDAELNKSTQLEAELAQRDAAAGGPVLDPQAIGWVDSEELRSIDKNRHATIYKIEPDNPYHDPRRQKLVYLAPPAASVNYPAIPEGWIPMPRKLTAENGAKAALSGDFTEHKFINCSECFGDDECESCDGSGRIKVEVTVSWSTIKAIWKKGADHFAAAPAPGGDGANDN